MTIEILVPVLPESVADATIATWHKRPGDQIERDEVIVEIETDKVILEVPAVESGVLLDILEDDGATVLGQQVIGTIKAGAVAGEETTEKPAAAVVEEDNHASPAVRRLLAEHGLDERTIVATGKNGVITKDDVEKVLAAKSDAKPATPATSTIATATVTVPAASVELAPGRSEKRVPMTRLRKRIAERLLEAKNSTAMLTTFNEINMKPIMSIRSQYKDVFEERHGIRLGFMSFYVKAVVEALKRYPEVNASLDGNEIVYHNYFDVSIAISTPRGLVTPVLRDCDMMSLADIEKNIRELAVKGRDGKLSIDDLTGGNFTVTNGGVFGSLMSTPIINPPQSAILGMHKIQDRPMAVDGKVEILPMMYLALSYDHRLIDGKESVGFLVTVKELLEDPTRLLLDV